MARIAIDGSVKVGFVSGASGIADITAPTVAELDAGISFADHLTPDGLNINVTEDNKDVTTLASKFNAQEPGRAGGDAALTYFRDDVTGSDLAYATLKSKTRGFLVVRIGPDESVAWTAADKVRVYPVQCGLQKDVPAAKNTDWQISQQLYISDDWEIDAVVAA